MRVSLITVGDPGRMTGGYLYHDRLARSAGSHRATMSFVSYPERAWPVATVWGPLLRRRARSADVVVLDSIAAALAAPWLRRDDVPPVVAMLHQPPGGIDHRALRRLTQTRLDLAAYRRVRAVIVASVPLRDDLVSRGWSPRDVELIPPGRDVSVRVRVPSSDLRAGRDAALLCVGNWVERKGIADLLESFARLPAELATLHLVGDTMPRSSYGRKVRERLSRPDIADRVVVHGPLPLDEVAGMYAASDVFVLPSEREPYGTVFGEALAAGLPVIGVDAGNLPHLITSGREGLIVPRRDVSALASAIERLASDGSLRTAMSQAAERRAASLPTWNETAAHFFDYLRRHAR
jgi:glycosyltransferase involved in cell wall biosynthesis